MEHQYCQALHGLYRTCEFHIRLCDLCAYVVLFSLQRLCRSSHRSAAKRSPGESVPNRVVRGIAPYSDSDRAHHKDQKGPLLREPCFPAPDLDNLDHHGHRRVVAIFTLRGEPRNGSLAPHILGLDCCLPFFILRVDAHYKDMVFQSLWRRVIMDTLLDALQEGRLIELPDNNKDDALQFLAHIIEAIPSLPTGIDVVGLVMAKERSTTSALGSGWAS